MFEVFDAEARDAIVRGGEEALRLGHEHIGTEHLLLGLLETSASALLRGHGIDRDRLIAVVGDWFAQGGQGERALAAIGISLPSVQASLESAFGSGALRQGDRPWNHTPFSGRAKMATMLAAEEARRLGHDEVEPRHEVLGILDALMTPAQMRIWGASPETVTLWEREGLFDRPDGGSHALSALGVDAAALRQQLLDELRGAR